jgi:hypothetical protein
MQIRDEVKRLLLSLQRNVLANRAEVIAPVESPGWLNAGENFHIVVTSESEGEWDAGLWVFKFRW